MSNLRLLKNGVWFNQGLGNLLRYVDGVVYLDNEAGETYKVVGNTLVLVSTPVLPESPNGFTVPTNGTQLVDAEHKVWTIQAVTNLVLRDGVSVLGATASSITISIHVVERIGLDKHRYAWNGTAWIDKGAILTKSPNGWVVPDDGTSLVDVSLDVWTIMADTGLVLRNGVSSGLGGRTAVALRFVNDVVKADGADGHRYAWNGTSWTDEGLINPVVLGSANGTRGASVTDRQGAVWTINLANNVVFKDGQATPAWASCLLMANDVVNHKGVSVRFWMKETPPGSNIFLEWNKPGDGKADPFTGAGWATRSPNGTFGTTVVFPDGQTWTRGTATANGFEVLREGLRMQNSECVNFLVYNDRLYWVDNTGNWWLYGGLQDGSGGMNAVGYSGTKDPRDPITPPSGDVPYVVTTGSIAQGTNRLTGVPAGAYATIQVGHVLVVELSDAMVRGSGFGPGGSFPDGNVATASALPAWSGSFRTMWARDTGHIWQNRGNGVWNDVGSDAYGLINRYTYGMVLPRSIRAQVLSKNAGEIFLGDEDGNPIQCQVTMTNTKVYVDVIPILDELINALPVDQLDYTLPAGEYPGCGVLWIRRNGFILNGFGGVNGSTAFFTPRGVIPVSIAPFVNVNGVTLRGFKIASNYYPDSNGDPQYYGLNYAGGFTPPHSNSGDFTGVTDFFNFPPQPLGVAGYVNSDILVEDVWADGYTNQAIGCSYAVNWLSRRCKGTINFNSYDYDGWSWGHYESQNSGMEDCVITARSLIAGPEQFRSSGGFFRRVNLTNADIAMNTAGGWIVEDCVQTYTTGCCIPMSYHSPRQSSVNINTNIGGNFAQAGGIVRNHTHRQLGYVRGGCVSKKGISVGDNNPNIRIERAYHEAPDYNPAVETYPTDPDGSSLRYSSGSYALESSGPSTFAGGVTCVGLSLQHYQQGAQRQANIWVGSGGPLPQYGANHGDPRTLAKWGAESVFGV